MDSISNLLTDEIVQSAPTKKKAYTIRDGRGLFVLVHPNGSRYFQLRATVEGKRKLMQLGVYPQVSIEEARALAVNRLKEALSVLEPMDGELSFEMNDQENNTAQFAGDAKVSPYEMEVPPQEIEAPPQEMKVMRFTEEAILADERSEKKRPPPQVNLRYSQLVYVPKTLPKTFSQKLSERAHPSVLWRRLLAKLTLLVNEIKQKLIAHLLAAKTKLHEAIQKQLQKIKQILRNANIYLASALGGIKNKLTNLVAKIKEEFSRLSRFKLSLNFKKKAITEPQVSMPPISQEEDMVSDLAGEIVKPPILIKPELALKTHVDQFKQIVLRKSLLLRQLGSNVVMKVLKSHAHLTRFIQDETRADRADVVAVYGLFAESKGNYFIYTIKSIAACILAKKG